MNDPIDIRRAADLLSECRQSLDGCGISILETDDFSGLKKTLDIERRRKIGSVFDTSFFELLPGTAFWLEGRNSSGELVSTVAVRLDNLGNGSLIEFWQRLRDRIYFAEQSEDPEPIKSQPLENFKVVSRRWASFGLPKSIDVSVLKF